MEDYRIYPWGMVPGHGWAWYLGSMEMLRVVFDLVDWVFPRSSVCLIPSGEKQQFVQQIPAIKQQEHGLDRKKIRNTRHLLKIGVSGATIATNVLELGFFAQATS